MKSFEEIDLEMKKKKDIKSEKEEEKNQWKVDDGSLIIGKVMIVTLSLYN